MQSEVVRTRLLGHPRERCSSSRLSSPLLFGWLALNAVSGMSLAALCADQTIQHRIHLGRKHARDRDNAWNWKSWNSSEKPWI